MIDHTGLSISDPVKSRRFYEQALTPLGYKVLMEVPSEFTGGVMVLGMGVPPNPISGCTKAPLKSRASTSRSAPTRVS